MAKRHEDRKPGARFSRSEGPARKGPPPRGGRPTRNNRSDRSDEPESEGGPSRPTGSGRVKNGPPAAYRGAGRPAGGKRPFGKVPTRKSGIRVTKRPAREVDDGKVRLNRFLAMAGVCSRRAADELIESGSIEVNGKTITELGFRVDPQKDKVAVDGEGVRQEKKVYVLFNKPTNVVCTSARNEQKKRVIDFLPEVKGRLFTVGRLDLDSEGLILLTNDGDFAQRLTHPSYGVPKTYQVVVRGRIGDKDIEKARGGIWLAEGPTQGMQIKVERASNDRSTLKVVLREGKNREIRRVFARLDLPVIELKRIRIGDLSLYGLKTGEWRFLQLDEVQGLLTTSREELPKMVESSTWGAKPRTKVTSRTSDRDRPPVVDRDDDDGGEQ